MSARDILAELLEQHRDVDPVWVAEQILADPRIAVVGLPEPLVDSEGECPEWFVGKPVIHDGVPANASVWIDDVRDEYPIQVKGDGIFKPDEAIALAAALLAAARKEVSK